MAKNNSEETFSLNKKYIKIPLREVPTTAGLTSIMDLKGNVKSFLDAMNSNPNMEIYADPETYMPVTVGAIRKDLEDTSSIYADNERQISQSELNKEKRLRQEKESNAKQHQNIREGLRGTADIVPYIGDALQIYDIGNDINKGNYLGAGIGAGLILLPNIIEKPLVKIGKLSKPLIRRQTSLKKAIRNTEKFEREDVAYRYRRALQDEIDSNKEIFGEDYVIPKEQQEVFENFNNNGTIEFDNTINAKGRYNDFTKNIKINSELADDITSTLVHEREHKFRNYLEDIKNSKQIEARDIDFISPENIRYTSKELEYLNNAYDLSHYRTPISEISEKSAINRQIRYKMYKDTGLTGKKLDEYIKKLDAEKLVNYIESLNSGYSGHIMKELNNLGEEAIKTNNIEEIGKKLINIKKALMYVAENNTNRNDFSLEDINIT